MENTNISIDRPWQGTTLVIINLTLLIAGVITLVHMSLTGARLGGVATGLVLPYLIFGGLIGALFLILNIRILKGRRDSLTFLLVIFILGIISNLMNISDITLLKVIDLAYLGFSLWLVIVCLKHPFYDKKTA